MERVNATYVLAMCSHVVRESAPPIKIALAVRETASAVYPIVIWAFEYDCTSCGLELHKVCGFHASIGVSRSEEVV